MNESIDTLLLMSGALNIPLVKDLHAVCDSNDSKFCATLSEAMKTKRLFTGRGVDTCISSTAGVFAIKPTRTQTVDGKEYPSGKLLKSVNYKEAVL